jgi:hypothetical protein
MATATINYDARNKNITTLLNKIKDLGATLNISNKKEIDDSLMSKEDYFAMLDESLNQAKEGKVYRMKENQTVKQFLEELCTV